MWAKYNEYWFSLNNIIDIYFLSDRRLYQFYIAPWLGSFDRQTSDTRVEQENLGCISPHSLRLLSVLAHFRDAVCKKPRGRNKVESFTGNWCQFRLTHRQRRVLGYTLPYRVSSLRSLCISFAKYVEYLYYKYMNKYEHYEQVPVKIAFVIWYFSKCIFYLQLFYDWHHSGILYCS